MQAGKPCGGDGTGAAALFYGNGDDDLIYGYLSDPDRASPEIVREDKGSRNVCICTGRDKVTLPDIYSYTPIGGLIPLAKVWMQNTITVHAWTGAEEQNDSEKGDTQEEMVYVTESGSVYHRKLGCRYLKVSLRQVSGSRISSMRNSYGEKYAACESCSRGQSPAGSVYVTSTGNRYHNQETCSGLKRTVKLVKLSQVGSMHACSSCG